MFMPDKIEVVVISVAGSESLPMLERTLEKLRFKYTVLLATTPENSEFKTSATINLSPVEIATAISHQRARTFVLEQGCEWAIILEDDAQILGDFVNVQSLVENIEAHFGQESKLAIHLFPEQFGILRSNSRESFFRVLSLPDCAVGYAMNKHALNASISIQGIENEVADWHSEIRKLTWLAPKASLVCHPDLGNSKFRSLTTNPRNNRVMSRSLLEKLITYPYLKMFILRITLPCLRSYGCNPISSEKLRTKILSTCKIRSRIGE